MNTNYVNYSSNSFEPVTAEFRDVVDEVKTGDETKMGIVSCSKLYLRSEPSANSESITVLNEGEELMIVSEDDEEWYGVYTAAGQEGFCKKEFIKID